KSLEKFKPRSFNMGFSEEVFKATGGFAKIAVGEDLDLSIRVEKKGFKTAYIPEAFVYHKRRNNWGDFYKQRVKFGMGRPILSRWYPYTFSFLFWLPSMFVIGAVAAIVLALFQLYWLFSLYILYFLLIFVSITYLHSSFKVGFLSL